MRTTIDLPDATFRQLKVLAAREGSSLKEVVLRAVDAELHRSGQPARQEAVRDLPVIPSKRPGTMNFTNAEIDEILAGR